MHLLMLLAAIAGAWSLRWLWSASSSTWNQRWYSTLSAFLLPPLLLLTTAIAVFWMGPRGQMVRWWEGWGSYGLSIGFLGVAGFLWVHLAIEAWSSLQQIRHHRRIDVQGTASRLIESSVPFVAQVGFWQPELVVSQGVLDTLDAEHLEAVLVHEQAHCQYRDTFWFFWLGWLRRLTAWLPQTEALWQELLILRELRADQWASQQVDSLLLAEALVSVISAPLIEPENVYAAFSGAAVQDRLTERIEALLAEPAADQALHWWNWLWLLVGLLPLIAIPFHT